MQGKHPVPPFMAGDLPFPTLFLNTQIWRLQLLHLFKIKRLLLCAQSDVCWKGCCGADEVHRVNESKIPLGLVLCPVLCVHGLVVQAIKPLWRVANLAQAVPDILGLKTELAVVASDGLDLLRFKHSVRHWGGAVAANHIAIKAKLADRPHDVWTLNHFGVALRQDAFQAIKDVLNIDGGCAANLLVYLLGYVTNLAVHRLRVVIGIHDLLDMLFVPEVKRSHGAGVQRHDLHPLRGQ